MSETSDERVQRYAEAIRDEVDHGDVTCMDAARAVMALADGEIAQVQEEAEGWAQSSAEAFAAWWRSQSVMSDLTEFLLARIAEDEGWAREALALSSIYKPDSVSWHWIVAHEDGSRWLTTSHDPARVLAECVAKRRIVHRLTDSAGEPFGPDEDADLRDLASIYADHPDYRQEWKPRTVSTSAPEREVCCGDHSGQGGRPCAGCPDA